MGYIFRINKTKGTSKTTIVDWSTTTSNTYQHGFVDKIPDATTTQREITSIPSPFARIELVKEAFGKIVPETLNELSVEDVREMLHGNSIYHKMVSDSLDVGQILFSYEAMKDQVDIIVWEKDKCIESLLNSNEKSHQIYGKTLSMFLSQDAEGEDPYNFGRMQKIYILRYKGKGKKEMHIIGATSPATLFFSTANDESSISHEICFGTDYAFDNEYASLDLRSDDYIKYLFAFRYSDSQFNLLYPEVAKYLDAVYFVLDDELKDKLDNIRDLCQAHEAGTSSYVDKTYEKLIVEVNETTSYQVEVNGKPLHYNKLIQIQQNYSDFTIYTSKTVVGNKPLVLPITNSNEYEDLNYYGTKFGMNQKVPYYDGKDLGLRRLPGLNIPYPYLTISDFLEDKIVKLPAEVNKKDYFDGNYTSNSGLKEGYLLPITDRFFDYFSVEDLKGKTPLGKNFVEIKQVASGVEVTLRIPIQREKEIVYKRIYTLDVKADKENNKGAIVVAPEDFDIGVFPPVVFADEKDAHYRIAILCDFALNKECGCKCHSEQSGFFVPNYVVRNVDIEDDIRSKVYILENRTFDSAKIEVFTDQSGREKKAIGLLVPKFNKRNGTSAYSFAIDLGTSNTHIEYTTGANQMPKPFAFDEEMPQISLVCAPTDVIRSHVRGEFIPEIIGENSQCHFPLRTVLCIEKNNNGINEQGTGAYVAFGNANPAFMYNKKDVGTKYNDFVPNLKWSQLNQTNEERIRCYIEALMLMIRAKVVQEGGSLVQTQVKWFYPISMSDHKRGLFERVWDNAYKKYFNDSKSPTAITESVAPYSFFQKTEPNVAYIVTIDIGGGTTDIVVADKNDDKDKQVKCITSMRFAADALFGNVLVSVENGTLNGIIKQFKDYFISKLEGLNDLQTMLKVKTASGLGNSAEVASFLFSLADNELVRKNNMREILDFNGVLMKDSTQKIVFYIFFTAIIYHLANLMKAKGLKVPPKIAFSGNGSKVITILSPKKEDLETLVTNIFGLIYKEDIKNIDLILNTNNPKEATCKGGLFLAQQPVNVNVAKTVLLGVSDSKICTEEKYSEAPNMFVDVVKEVRAFMDFITLKLPKRMSLNNYFGIDNNAMKLAIECFNKDLTSYIQNGIDLKIQANDVSKDDIIEEPLFFYPIIGVMNDLSMQIYNINK